MPYILLSAKNTCSLYCLLIITYLLNKLTIFWNFVSLLRQKKNRTNMICAGCVLCRTVSGWHQSDWLTDNYPPYHWGGGGTVGLSLFEFTGWICKRNALQMPDALQINFKVIAYRFIRGFTFQIKHLGASYFLFNHQYSKLKLLKYALA